MINETFILKRCQCTKLEQIEYLNLSNLDLGSLDSTIFHRLSNLKSLNVSGNKLRTLIEIAMPHLLKLNCEDNMINDVQFLDNFPGLEELYITGNPLGIDDRYIAVSKLPNLKLLDGKECTVLKSKNEAVKTKVEPMAVRIWESQFSHKLYNGITEVELKDLEIQFIRQLQRSVLQCSNVPKKFMRYKVEKIGQETHYIGLKRLQIMQQSPAINIQNHCHERNSQSSVTYSAKLDGNEIIPVCNVRKRHSSYSVENNTFLEKEKLVVDYVPLYFLRCHSILNDPGDAKTQVWKAAFEPDIISTGQTTYIAATCGGNIVCLVDCRVGRVIKRYKHPNNYEDLFSLSWTVVTLGKNKTTLLAVGGRNREIHLLHPSQLICYHTYKAHNRAINSLLFHPSCPTWLFSGGTDGQIHLWDIGVPVCPDYTTKVEKLFTFSLEMEVIQLAFSTIHNILFAACDGGLVVWNIDSENMNEIQRDGIQFESEVITINGKEEHILIDGLSILSADYFAIKIAKTGEVRICTMQDIVKQKKNLHCAERLKFTYSSIRQWSNCLTDYLSMGCFVDSKNCIGLLASGDDCGQIWLYAINLQVTSKAIIPEGKIPASSILSWPELVLDPANRYQVPPLDTEKICINSTVFSWDGKYLLACTDKNLLCIWKREV